MSDEERKTYKITADYKKSTYQEEHWTNQLKNGKYVARISHRDDIKKSIKIIKKYL